MGACKTLETHLDLVVDKILPFLAKGRSRYYNPGTGRFLQEDPIGFGGGDSNFYRYVSNNPLNLFDPFGLVEFNTISGGGAGNFTEAFGDIDEPGSAPFDFTDIIAPIKGFGKKAAKEAGKKAKDILSGKLKREFPSQFLEKSLNEIKRLIKKPGTQNLKDLRKAKKILQEQERLQRKLKGKH